MLLEALFLGVVLGGEALQRSAAVRQVEAWDRELRQMEVWDGVEHQIKQHCDFYNQRIVPQERYFVFFGGNKSKGCHISVTDVKANRQYWQSGLNAKDFAVKYFRGKFADNKKWEEKFDPYRPNYTAGNDLFLFDKTGEQTHFILSRCYDKIATADWDKYRILRQYKGGNIVDEVIFPINEPKTLNNCHG
ncbi:MAG: hypothetical protein Q3982_02425 [Phoenicibacter congonensis]|uniref:Uncharacterized protein n=1 Tax=Phoenicibacter congonensis TaxID=1944646 RepID=A0AA43RIK9_9ACTN|nr:hypothetical protein [Phoenicibacter congonensis]